MNARRESSGKRYIRKNTLLPNYSKDLLKVDTVLLYTLFMPVAALSEVYRCSLIHYS